MPLMAGCNVSNRNIYLPPRVPAGRVCGCGATQDRGPGPARRSCRSVVSSSVPSTPSHLQLTSLSLDSFASTTERRPYPWLWAAISLLPVFRGFAPGAYDARRPMLDGAMCAHDRTTTDASSSSDARSRIGRRESFCRVRLARCQDMDADVCTPLLLPGTLHTCAHGLLRTTRTSPYPRRDGART